ncbi:hypothetical protein [Erythrobacter aureus]|uniref:Uncharacterized protein n=1 Tax=Erythrobacter aureus TaxID=2182384 RepID=A0A345YJH8_9SPHN|nr:hypothetical protein [Erythrobacter aureus]AXK44080.1 hypothetical protein DVR09_16640 [Erythrobacter aureus]
MTYSTELAARLRDDLIAASPEVVKALPIAEALSIAARLDLVKEAKNKVDGLIDVWPSEVRAMPDLGSEAPAAPKKAKRLKEMQRRLSMALEVSAKGADLLGGDEEQAINLVVAWLMSRGGTELRLPDGRILDVSGKITLH